MNLVLTEITSSSVRVNWSPPSIRNGIIRQYDVVLYNSSSSCLQVLRLVDVRYNSSSSCLQVLRLVDVRFKHEVISSHLLLIVLRLFSNWPWIFTLQLLSWSFMLTSTVTCQSWVIAPSKAPACFLEQETLPRLLSTGWFQERIRAWFT